MAPASDQTVKITSKRQFFDLWEAGVLGNRTMIWHDVEDALASGSPKIGFREVGKTGGGLWELVVRAPNRDDYAKTVREVATRWRMQGRRFILDNSVPNEKSTMQGEVCRTYQGLQSFLAIGRGLPPMRLSIAAGLHAHRNGCETNLLLDQYMDPSSRDDLRDLMDLYPDAAIEFTCFSVNVGNLPHRNTILWETRDY